MPEYLEKSKGSANFWQVYFIGISMVMAGHCAFWTSGLHEGFWEYFISIMFVSIAFLCLCLCLAEMISILPFGGGAYGFARVTMGPFLGFMVGFFDSISNIIYVSQFVRIFVAFFNYCINVSYHSTNLPYMWVIVYTGVVALHVALGKFNFWFIAFMGLVVLAIPIVFILGTTNLQNYQDNVVDQERLYQHVFMPLGARGFIRFLPISALLYFGIDMMCLVCEDTKNPSLTVPKALMAVLATLFCLAIALLFSVSSQYPGVIYTAYNILPLTFGFASLFKTDYQRATISVLPSIMMEMYALSYAFGRQMCALSRSSLLPSMFSWTSYGNVPYISLIVGSVLGMLNLVVLNYIDPQQFEVRIGLMYSVAQLCSIIVYVISMLSFVVFRMKYSILKRPFNVGCLGVPLAALGIIIFVTVGYALAFLENDNHYTLKAFAILTSFGVAYYFLYARSRQSFSQEEQSILFAVYVIKANSKHRTVYRWFEKKYNRYILRNVSSVSLAIRTSLRKSTTRTRTKVTPHSADAKKAAMTTPPEVVAKTNRIMPQVSVNDELHHRLSSIGSTADVKPSDSTRDFETELGAKFELAPVCVVEMISHAATPELAPDKTQDSELDVPVDARTRFKLGFQTKSDIRLDGLIDSVVSDQ